MLPESFAIVYGRGKILGDFYGAACVCVRNCESDFWLFFVMVLLLLEERAVSTLACKEGYFLEGSFKSYWVKSSTQQL